jgi:hypothetical protein
MMHGPEESDSVIVAVKPTNKAVQSVAEPVEPRTETKGNADQQSTRRAQDRGSVSQALERVRQVARQRKKERFTSLLHHVDPAMLRTAFHAMKRDAAPGVDGMTWEIYERDLDRRIEELHARIKSGAYRALPSRRSYIPKEDGSKRPLAVMALEDKIVQFGRFAAQNCKKRGRSKPETFKFLGFVLICDKSRRGDFRIRRKSRQDRMRVKLRELKEALRRRINRPIPETGKWLAQVVAGYFAYHAVPTNGLALAAFRYHVAILWHRQLCRRSQRARLVWTQMAKLVDEFLPKPQILHPWPSVRFAVRHPR